MGEKSLFCRRTYGKESGIKDRGPGEIRKGPQGRKGEWRGLRGTKGEQGTPQKGEEPGEGFGAQETQLGQKNMFEEESSSGQKNERNRIILGATVKYTWIHLRFFQKL